MNPIRQTNKDQGNFFTQWKEVVHSGNINTFTQPTLNAKQDQLTFPSKISPNGWRVVSNNSIARRLIGDGKIRVMGVLDFLNGGSIKDIQIG